jgi:hypothetical protein
MLFCRPSRLPRDAAASYRGEGWEKISKGPAIAVKTPRQSPPHA